MVETFDEKRYNYILEKCVTFFVYTSHIGEGGEIVEDFEKVYSLYYPDVFKYLLSLSNNSDIAQELTQETFFFGFEVFLKISEEIAKYEYGYVKLPNIPTMRT